MTSDRPIRRVAPKGKSPHWLLGLAAALALTATAPATTWAAPPVAQDAESREAVIVNRRVEISADEDGEGIRRCRALVHTNGQEQEFRCEMRDDGSGAQHAVFFDQEGNEVALEDESLFQGKRVNAFFIGDSGDHNQGTDVQVIGFDDHGKPRGYLGAHLTDLTPELRTHFGAPPERGVLLARIEPDSPAARAGLQVGDLLTAIDGTPLLDSAAVRRTVRQFGEGDTAVFDVLRGRKKVRATVTFVEKAVPEVDVRRLLWHDGDSSASSFAYQVNRPQVEDAILELHRTLPAAAPCADLEQRLRQMEKKIELLSKQLEGR